MVCIFFLELEEEAGGELLLECCDVYRECWSGCVLGVLGHVGSMTRLFTTLHYNVEPALLKFITEALLRSNLTSIVT